MSHSMSKTAQPGDRVRVQYLALLKDGSNTQKNPGRHVLDFTVGSKEVIAGISSGVVGMATGEQKRLTLQPQDAYGAIRRNLIHEIPRERLSSHFVLRVGKRLVAVTASSGRRRQVRIIEINPQSVIVDGNHPLAGKILEVELQLVSLNSTSAQARRRKQDAGGEG